MKKLNDTLTPFKKRIVKTLQVFFYQGGKWYPLSQIEKRRGKV